VIREDFIKGARSYFEERIILIQETAGNELPEEEEIKLLVLRVTNDCNLRCRYCYACGGDSRESIDRKSVV